MRIFKVKAFERWARASGIRDGELREAIREVHSGLVDARLGGHLYKKRIAISSRGKSGGGRTIIAFITSERNFFIFGYLKNERENLDAVDLKALKQYAAKLLVLTNEEILELLSRRQLFEVESYG